MISPTFLIRVSQFAIQSPCPSSFWFLNLTPFPFQNITQKFSLAYPLFTNVYFFSFYHTYGLAQFYLLDYDWAVTSSKSLLDL